MRNFLLSAICLFLGFISLAQEKSPVKFGKISADDFKTTVYTIDSSAAAVVIADIGYSYYEGNTDGWFTFFHNRHKRVHILNKNGYDAANVEIQLYINGSVEEELQSLKAYTYNLENGKVTEAKLENKSVFKDVLDKNHIIKKFTFPNVKEGSIIEFSYTIKSDFWSSPANWFFQDQYPVLWSELEFHIPEFFYFTFITEGYNPFYKKQPPESSTVNFDVAVETLTAGERMQRNRLNISAQVLKHRWVMKDIPGLKPEKFTSSIMNFISKIEFQLVEKRQPLEYKTYMGTWPLLTQKLLQTEYFGLHINNANAWMDDDLKNITRGLTNEREKAKRIYEYVRDNFTCTDYSALYMTQVLKNVMKSRKGNVAEINLLLIAMLKNAGIKADPVILSTKSNGYVYALYPLEDKFNYVIASTKIENNVIYLDATRPKLGFGLLPSECYNGHARIVNVEATPLELNPDSLLEGKVTSIFISNEEKGNMSGRLQQLPGLYESYNIRRRVAEKGIDALFSDYKKAFSMDIQVYGQGIDSLAKPDEPLSVQFDFTFVPDKADIIYFNPVQSGGYKENPFKSAVRLYPVEMPYAIDETYILRMDIPEGFIVDELPKSLRINFDEEGKSFFEYLINNSNAVISLRSRVKLNRTYYTPEEYEILRDFFGLIVDKHNEQVVFKRKK
jgi:hypothetical protein